MDWTQILSAIVVLAVIIYLWPSAGKMLEQSKQAENKDWQGALLPLGMVILFVILLIAASRS
ncbi:MAG: hypothetical protein AAF410_02295 [Pseudomonadota bacterium]